MRSLIVLRGNSGSGKTTVAKELQKKFGRNTMLISQDAVRRDMLKVRDGYKPLFELAVQLYDKNIFAYYFDIPFEETLKRHQTKPNCCDFGEEEMRRWWREKDYSNVLKECAITMEDSVADIVEYVYDAVVQGKTFVWE